MNLAEYYDVEHILEAETQALARWCAEHGRNAPAGEQSEPAPQPDPQPQSQPQSQGQVGPFEGTGMPRAK
jgi:hypothetical protein